MITCPWCGTNYAAFQPNCKNCGGPLPMPSPATAPPDELPPPPHPPRPIADSYAWKLLFADGWFIAGMVFGILGVVFGCVGIVLTVTLVAAMVGIPFALMAVPFLGAAGAALAWRYQIASKTVRVLQAGEAARGEILATEINYSVRVNGRSPWTISYRFQVFGRDYSGAVTTLNTPGSQLQPGRAVYVLYLPDTPENNTIYPHP